MWCEKEDSSTAQQRQLTFLGAPLMGCKASRPKEVPISSHTHESAAKLKRQPALQSYQAHFNPTDESSDFLSALLPFTLAGHAHSLAGYYPGQPVRKNQDSFLLKSKMKNPHTAIFGVFDGHGTHGDKVSAFAANRVTSVYESCMEHRPVTEAAWAKALAKAYTKIDKQLSHSLIDDTNSGTTAVCALVVGHTIVVANCGDSRAVAAYATDAGLDGDSDTAEGQPPSSEQGEGKDHPGLPAGMVANPIADKPAPRLAVRAKSFNPDQQSPLKSPQASPEQSSFVPEVAEESGSSGGRERARGQNYLRAEALTSDHSVFRQDERERVAAAGAVLLSSRQCRALIDGKELGEDVDVDALASNEIADDKRFANGDFPRIWRKGMEGRCPGAMFTRSIGDRSAKTVGVNAEAELRTLYVTPSLKLLILASDGVWEYFGNQEVVDIFQKHNPDIEKACKEVVDMSYQRWMQSGIKSDDITCVALRFSRFESKRRRRRRSRGGNPNSSDSIDTVTSPRPVSPASTGGASSRSFGGSSHSMSNTSVDKEEVVGSKLAPVQEVRDPAPS